MSTLEAIIAAEKDATAQINAIAAALKPSDVADAISVIEARTDLTLTPGVLAIILAVAKDLLPTVLKVLA